MVSVDIQDVLLIIQSAIFCKKVLTEAAFPVEPVNGLGADLSG